MKEIPNKKVIVIFGGSGELGELLFKDYDRENFIIINISKNRVLDVEGVVTITADVTKKMGLLYAMFKLKSLVYYVDVVVLGSMFIYHKNLFSLTKKELTYEFDVNVFSQIEIIKSMLLFFWKNSSYTLNSKKCFYISSAVSLGITEREDLQSYAIEKMSVNFVAKYFESELARHGVESFLYLPASIKKQSVSTALYGNFWQDITRVKVEKITERTFL